MTKPSTGPVWSLAAVAAGLAALSDPALAARVFTNDGAIDSPVMTNAFFGLRLVFSAVAVTLLLARRRLAGRLTGILVNTTLLTVSLIAAFFLAELAVRLTLDQFPLSLHSYLPAPYRVLAMSSKSGVVPRRYVALAGDSNAQGAGDWLFSADHSKNSAFGSQHALYQAAGRNVLSFGTGGAYSIRGLAVMPAVFWKQLNSAPFYRLGPPSEIYAYFYEGNDPDNTLDTLEAYFTAEERSGAEDPAVFRRALDRLVEKKSANLWRDNFVVLGLVQSLIESLFGGIGPLMQGDLGETAESSRLKEPNRVFAGGSQALEVPFELQAPSMGLSEGEMTLAVYGFRESLRYLQRMFPAARVSVVYIPSPTAVYRFDSSEVRTTPMRGRGSSYSPAAVRERSDRIFRLIADASAAAGAAMIDARPALRRAAEEAPVHGPKDWNHLNRRGYETLARAILEKTP